MKNFNATDFVIDSLQEYGTYFNESRAIPSILDGCKPSQRKILYSAHLIGLKPTGKYRKVVNLVGETTKIYLHGPASLESAITRMGQRHKMTYPLLEGSGNWGSQSLLSAKDSGAAAVRYIECRMSPIGGLLIESLKNGTAKMTRNFDNTMDEPEHFFAPIPVFLLFNQLGIGVGTATSIPSFRLTSVINATEALMKNRELTTLELASILQPYYTQKATIINKDDLPSIYGHKPRDGRERSIKFKATFEIKGDFLLITDFPYDASPDIVVAQIEKALEIAPIFANITKVQDTTTLVKGVEKVQMEIKFKRKTDVDDLIQTLCERTSLQSSVSVNMVLLDKEGHVKEYSVRTALLEWIDIYLEKVVQQLTHEKNKLEAKVHLLEGLIKALDEIDEIIELIKSSLDRRSAEAKLIERGYSSAQAKGILDMKLVRLANMEYKDLLKELESVKEEVLSIILILEDKDRLIEYSTKLMNSFRALELYSTPVKQIEEQYAKRQKVKETKVIYAKLEQSSIKYGSGIGKGIWKTITKDDPAYALCKDKIIPIKEEVFAKSVDLLLQEELLSYDVVTFNKEGKIKRTEGSNLTCSKEVSLTSQKDVIGSLLAKPGQYVKMTTKDGMENIFEVSEIKATGRGALGVIGIKLSEGDEVVSAEVITKPKWTGKRANKGRKIKNHSSK